MSESNLTSSESFFLSPFKAEEVDFEENKKDDSRTKLVQLEKAELFSRVGVVLSSNENYGKVVHIRNMYLESQLQVGPKCGLVALSIASSGTDNFVKVDDILRTALSLGFTKKGEMFSTEWLAALAEKCCGFRATVLRGGLKRHLRCIVQNLMRGRLILVPYDADFNHSPCCKKGWKAHWAVISGLVVIEGGGEGGGEDDERCNCPEGDGVTAHEGRVAFPVPPGGGEDVRRGTVYLIGKQGKSKHPGVWSFDAVADSNENLVSTGRSSEEHQLPEGGIVEGLRGKALFLDHPTIRVDFQYQC